jgi:hypothetical protein
MVVVVVKEEEEDEEWKTASWLLAWQCRGRANDDGESGWCSRLSSSLSSSLSGWGRGGFGHEDRSDVANDESWSHRTASKSRG